MNSKEGVNIKIKVYNNILTCLTRENIYLDCQISSTSILRASKIGGKNTIILFKLSHNGPISVI